jgi:hypothetical protein
MHDTPSGAPMDDLEQSIRKIKGYERYKSEPAKKSVSRPYQERNERKNEIYNSSGAQKFLFFGEVHFVAQNALEFS